MSFLRRLEPLVGMFHCLLGVLMSGLVIFFPVVHGGNNERRAEANSLDAGRAFPASIAAL
jgi:hypothetical protein